jgi:hypothetical protein
MSRHRAYACCSAVLAMGVLVVGIGCGAGAQEGGGGDNLPTRLAGPYEKLPDDPDTDIDEPIVLEDPAGERAYYGPSALRADDGSYTVYFTAEDGDGAAHLLRAEGVDLANEPREVAVVLEADVGWEATRLAHPAVVKPGLDGAAYGLFYEAGVGAIGYADSPDGRTFTRHADNPILSPIQSEEGARLGHPTAVWHQERVLLYYTAGSPGALFVAGISGAGGGGISVERLDASPMEEGRTPVLAPNPSPLPDLFDETALGGASISISNEAGRAVFDLWYAGRRADGDWSIGFAGSYDGLEFKRFEDNPVLKSGIPMETDPCVISQSISAVMFYTHGEGSRRTIGAARY